MDEKIDKAVEVLTGKIVQSVQPDQALKFTQAALNLAHVKAIYAEANAGKKKAGA